jgi:hypothetical protein
MVAPLTIGPGIDIGGGVVIGNVPTVTINSSDFNYGSGAGGTSAYVTNGSGDLVCPLYYLNVPTGSIGTQIVNFFAACGYDINTSYVFHATFASAIPLGGGLTTPYSCLVRASWGSGQLNLAVIDQGNPNWNTGNPNQGVQLQGTFTLPLTLMPYNPTTSMSSNSNWC